MSLSVLRGGRVIAGDLSEYLADHGRYGDWGMNNYRHTIKEVSRSVSTIVRDWYGYSGIGH